MSSESNVSSEKVKAVRWRLHLPSEIVQTIMSLSLDEERDPGDIATRWIKAYWKDHYPTAKDELSG